MAVTAADFNGDGWPDLFTSYDTLLTAVLKPAQRNVQGVRIEKALPSHKRNGAASLGMG